MSLDRFNRLAKDWDSKPERVAGAMTFVDKISEDLPLDIKHFDILDYGCGSGLVSFGFAHKVHSVLGLDNSLGMVEVYNDKASKIGLDNIIAKVHDINKDHLIENMFDLVVTNMTMHHIKDTKMFIEKLANSLKSSGKLFIADLVSEDGKFHSDNEGVEHFGFSMDEIKSLFVNAGLHCVNIEVFHTIEKPHNCYDIFIASGTKI
ncbi:MAG: class I SAM-dependent methyltransferase [Campylobacterales bacterium]|nr:class I SAM-dependent methyltransferase [Campylobacterales bacterium]